MATSNASSSMAAAAVAASAAHIDPEISSARPSFSAPAGDGGADAGGKTASSRTEHVCADSDDRLHAWDESAQAMLHCWYPEDARKHGMCSRCKCKISRLGKDSLKCAACHIRIHQACLHSDLRTESVCRPTFTRLTTSRKTQTPTVHHWVTIFQSDRTDCSQCNRSVGTKHSKRCAWCKRTVHLQCLEKMEESLSRCDLGEFGKLVLPASAILYGPKEAFESHSIDDAMVDFRNTDVNSQRIRSMSLNVVDDIDMPRASATPDDLSSEEEEEDALSRHTHKLSKEKRRSVRRSLRKARAQPGAHAAGSDKTNESVFHIDTPPGCTPLLVFINPKSGGNQGAKLLAQFQWWLNPRQVFNLMARATPNGPPDGPRRGLEIFRHVKNLHILVCGGDGTVGWVLETLDKMGLSRQGIPVGTLPLGTGNDLARELKWGGGYEGMSISKFLLQVASATTTKMDRWSIKLERDIDFNVEAAEAQDGVKIAREPPLSIMNNYFSVGSDAHTALKFHLAREANPKSFDNRNKNKAYYALQGAKEVVWHKFRNLSSDIKLVCDGKDYTDTIKRKGIEAVAFLNISSYAAGTRPWGTKTAVDEFAPPRIDDGKVEVVGFEGAWEMAMGQMGISHALRICQCHEALITLRKPLPIQVDGEPVLLAPGVISVTHKNQATMLCRPKGRYQRDAASADNLLEGEAAAGAGKLAAAESSEEEEAIEKVEVYLVPLEGDHTGVLKSLGAVSISPLVSLRDARSALSEQLHVAFRHSAGWRYLQYRPSQREGQQGSYFMVTAEEERQLVVRSFAHPTAKIKAGLFISQLPGVRDMTLNAEEEFLSAIADGNVSGMESSLRQGVSIDAVDEADRSALHIAVLYNRLDIVRLLLETYKVDPNRTDRNNRTPLHIACMRGFAEICQMLMHNGADTALRDRGGNTPEELAVIHENVQLLPILAELPLFSDSSIV
eukprot:m.74593 g.74593  ORF g.74593 m.74593 type:complete len:953 (-) comp14519_c0_seq1:63-2921(-)